MSGILETFFLSMTPIGELRAAIPVALTVYELHWLLAYIVAVIGNLVPVVFLLLLLGFVSSWLSQRCKFCSGFFNWLFARTRRRVGDRRSLLALVCFVAIPLPVTGAWTGSLIAYLFNIPFKKAFPVISLGVMIAGVIVLLATQAGISIERYLGWQALVVVFLIITLIYLLYDNVKSRSLS